ncbi:hypothetical protein QOT17_009333 [Balamuthia mandrillaris]
MKCFFILLFAIAVWSATVRASAAPLNPPGRIGGLMYLERCTNIPEVDDLSGFTTRTFQRLRGLELNVSREDPRGLDRRFPTFLPGLCGPQVAGSYLEDLILVNAVEFEFDNTFFYSVDLDNLGLREERRETTSRSSLLPTKMTREEVEQRLHGIEGRSTERKAHKSSISAKRKRQEEILQEVNERLERLGLKREDLHQATAPRSERSSLAWKRKATPGHSTNQVLTAKQRAAIKAQMKRDYDLPEAGNGNGLIGNLAGNIGFGSVKVTKFFDGSSNELLQLLERNTGNFVDLSDQEQCPPALMVALRLPSLKPGVSMFVVLVPAVLKEYHMELPDSNINNDMKEVYYFDYGSMIYFYSTNDDRYGIKDLDFTSGTCNLDLFCQIHPCVCHRYSTGVRSIELSQRIKASLTKKIMQVEKEIEEDVGGRKQAAERKKYLGMNKQQIKRAKHIQKKEMLKERLLNVKEFDDWYDFLECDPLNPAPEDLFTITITTDDFPTETRWFVYDENTLEGFGVAPFGTYTDPHTTYSDYLILPEDTCYIFYIEDAEGDGLEPPATYTVTFGEETFTSPNNNSFGFAEPIRFGRRCGHRETLKIEITTDKYPQEISWFLEYVPAGGNVAAVYPGEWAGFFEEKKTVDVSLDPTQCYSFQIIDAGGDGLESDPTFGTGVIELIFEGETIPVDANFGASSPYTYVGNCAGFI